MEHVATRDRFWNLAPAADRIFNYVQNDPSLRGMPFDFDYGLVDGPSSRAVAKFSCAGSTGSRPAVVWVTAATQANGSWLMSHSLNWRE